MSLPDIKITDARSTDKAIQYYNQKALVDNNIWSCCANCFSVNGFNCNKHKQQIPPKVAVLGCDQWDGLPF